MLHHPAPAPAGRRSRPWSARLLIPRPSPALPRAPATPAQEYAANSSTMQYLQDHDVDTVWQTFHACGAERLQAAAGGAATAAAGEGWWGGDDDDDEEEEEEEEEEEGEEEGGGEEQGNGEGEQVGARLRGAARGQHAAQRIEAAGQGQADQQA